MKHTKHGSYLHQLTKFGAFKNLLFPFPALPTWGKPAALATAQHLQKQKPALLAVGHGPVIRNLKKQWSGQSEMQPKNSQ